MDRIVGDERDRLIEERRRHADAERRSPAFLLQLTVSLGLFALAPLLPRAHHLFGVLTVRQMLMMLTPGLVAAYATTFVYRRFGGGGTRIYGIFEAVESFFLYAANLETAFGTNIAWTVVWILCPFTAVFWASTKPFDRRLHVGIVWSTHALLAVVCFARGEPTRALVALAVGFMTYLIYELLALQGRKSVDLEAERNVARRQLDEALLDRARRHVATTLREGIGREIADLASELDEDGAEHARGTLADLEAVSRATPSSSSASRLRSLVDLLRRIDDKCRPLCGGYSSETVEDRTIELDDERAGGLVRLAQELVRNAVVHGTADRVRVHLEAEDALLTLRVEDDGSGLTRERFEQATGGLSNAVAWLGDHGGRLSLVSAPAAGTTLAASLPTA